MHSLSRLSKTPAHSHLQTPAERWPNFEVDEIEAVIACLRTGTINQWTGNQVGEFERSYAEYLGVRSTIALANGSLALELALKTFGIGPGDDVIVTPRSFVASASCVSLVGARPVFADVAQDSGAISPDTIEQVITDRTRAIVPVHLGGWPADMPAIMGFARSRGIIVIEDCAQAHGATIDGVPVGSFGDAAAFSFCQDKIITTGGEGGLVVFRDQAADAWARSFKDHGKNFDTLAQPAEPGNFRWLHDTIGTNWRMTSMAAAIGLRQLVKLPEWRAIRERNARIWHDALIGIPGLRVPWPRSGVNAAFYKFYCFIETKGGLDVAESRRNAILRAAAEANIRLFSGSCSEIYREKAFADLQVAPLPVAHVLGATSLMLEVHPTLDEMRLRARANTLAQIIRDILR